MTTRRDFIKKAFFGTTALSLAPTAFTGLSARGYSHVMGSNDRIRVAAIGVHARGAALAANFVKQRGCVITYVCDVDKRAAAKCAAAVEQLQGTRPIVVTDFRKALESRDVDAVFVATPDHWHALASLLAMQAGKDVYSEKPASYCPSEGEILIEAVKKYGRVYQIGTQRRSWPNVIEGIRAVKEGAIGNVHFGKAWYTNNRPPIGIGKETEVPAWLDWNLWQGPAPRRAFKDNIVHYNWHWFWHWGTGEALNNGTHMIDLLRWGMDLDYPTMVNAVGGRYFGNDDWETPDTQVINFDYDGKKSLSYEGRSCNGKMVEGNSVGVMFFGDKGSLLIAGNNGYSIFDMDNQVVKQQYGKISIDPRNLMNPAEALDAIHINNFFDAIRKGTALCADVKTGHVSTLLMQLGNISTRLGRTLYIDPLNGHILHDEEANAYWTREYQPGFEMKL